MSENDVADHVDNHKRVTFMSNIKAGEGVLGYSVCLTGLCLFSFLFLLIKVSFF